MKSIHGEWGKELRRLRKYEQQWLRLQSKDFVYHIDVELDQIMAFFRISFPENMEKLEPGLQRLNELRIQHLDQRQIEFVLE